MRRGWLVAIVLVAGCSETPETFWRGLTRATCKFNAGCGKVSNDERTGRCAKAMYAEGIDPDEFVELCEAYDSEAGKTCLRHVRGAWDACTELETTPEQCMSVCGEGVDVRFEYRAAGGEKEAWPIVSSGAWAE